MRIHFGREGFADDGSVRNPIGGIVIANINRQNIQIKEWTQFISDNECVAPGLG